MHCGYCYYNTDYLHVPIIADPSFEDLKQRLLLAKKIGADSVSFTGGEPFIRSDILFDLIDYADYLQMNIVVVTNGKYFQNQVDEIFRCHLNKIKCIAISLHIDVHTDIDNYFSDIKNAIENNLAFFTNRIRFNFTLTRNNVSHLSKCLAFADRLGIDLHIQPVVIKEESEKYSDYSLSLLTPDEKKSVCKQIRSYAAKNEDGIYMNKLCDLLQNGCTEYKTCLAGKNFFVISEDGHILPCFYRESSDCGIISVTSVKSVSERLSDFYHQCKKCANEQCITLSEFGEYF